MLTSRLLLVFIVAGGFAGSAARTTTAAEGWSELQVAKFPASEKP